MSFRKGWNCLILAFVCSLWLSSMSFSSMTPQSVDELTANSSHIMRGEVLSVVSQWNADQTSIYTKVTVAIAEMYKGSGITPPTATILVPGGTVDDTKLWVEHTPTFSVGQEVVTFLIDHGSFYDVTSWVQGKYTIENEAVIELGSSATHFINQINEVVATERKRNGEK